MYTVAVSGGFDPLHVGHVRMLKEAATLGSLVVILNSDDFLMKKKGKVFMSAHDRAEILMELECVDRVVHCIDQDMTVKKTLKMLKPRYFCNGGDRHSGNIPEKKICERNGIELVFGVGGDKIRSSSELLNAYGD